ncbi:MAG TPA: rod shape-determining protein RodA [Flavobacterium sp.]|nr:rod shape-determining protein RodA [Flavobacterium sp.]
MKNQSTFGNIDWVTILLYLALVFLGWINIYSASVPVEGASFFDFSSEYGKQLIFILSSFFVIGFLLALDAKFYEKYAGVFYFIALLSLAGLYVFGKTVKGQTNWYGIGSFSLQPSEFAKVATALALAKFSEASNINLDDFTTQIKALSVIGIPMLLILPNDPGSALVFMFLVFALYREGLPFIYLLVGAIVLVLFVLALVVEVWIIILSIFLITAFLYFRTRKAHRNIIASLVVFVGISVFVFSSNYIFENVLQSHHRDRINIVLGKEVDLRGAGYNLNQSKIAIGSGGLSGKGFLEGTQTKGSFVPEQHTDYIFTTIAEEWGFLGATTLIALYVFLMLRILHLAEKQRSKFSRVYGYGVVSILFIHFFANIGMVLGIFPTIGIPLPLFSYGGSGLWAYTVLIFIFIKLDANKVNEW